MADQEHQRTGLGLRDKATLANLKKPIPNELCRRSQQIESYRAPDVIGLTAGQFWEMFIVNNLPLIVTGSLETYPTSLTIAHHTHPHAHAPHRCDTPLPEIITRLTGLPDYLPTGSTAAISHTFGLSANPKAHLHPWDGRLTAFSVLHTALIGIDLEAPPTEEFLTSLIRSFSELNEPVVIFHTGGGYFASCLGQAFTDDFSLSRAYARLTRRIIMDFEPHKLSWAGSFILSLSRCRTRENYEAAARQIEKCVGHWPEDNSCCVNLRHFKNAALANNCCHDNIPHTPGDPLTIQMYLRVGLKRGDDIPRIVYASPRIPFLIGKTIPCPSIA